MQPGKILVAQHQGTFVIKLIGDVRLTLCASFDEFVERMFDAPDFLSVMIDLSDAEGIDSTTLGLLARLAVEARRRFELTPVIFSPDDGITRLLQSMGFDSVFELRRETLPVGVELGELPSICHDEQNVRECVLKAHRQLMSMNDRNRDAFTGLITALEANG